MTSNEPAHGRAGTDGRAAQTGKEAAKKTVGKIAEKVVSWLKKVLWEKPIEYIKLKGKKYLKIAGEKGKQKAELIAEGDVPSKYQRKISDRLEQMMSGTGSQTRGSGPGRTHTGTTESSSGSNRNWRCGTNSGSGNQGRPASEPQPTTPRTENSRGQGRQPAPRRPEQSMNSGSERDDGEVSSEEKKLLRDAPPEVVAELAANDQRIRSYVLENPGLVDASSREEAERKIELMSGATAENLTQFDTRSSDVDGLLKDLGPEWSARLGYNELGQGFPDALNQASGSDGDSSSGHTSARTGNDLAGIASGTVETDTGSTSFTTGSSGSSSGSGGGANNGIGNAGGAGNGISSGGSGNGGGI